MTLYLSQAWIVWCICLFKLLHLCCSAYRACKHFYLSAKVQTKQTSQRFFSSTNFCISQGKRTKKSDYFSNSGFISVTFYHVNNWNWLHIGLLSRNFRDLVLPKMEQAKRVRYQCHHFIQRSYFFLVNIWGQIWPLRERYNIERLV